MTTYFLKRSKQIWTAASEPFKRDTTTFSSRHMYFGLVAAIGFPLYYVIWQVWFPQPYENLPLRVLGSVIFLPIVFARLWPEFLKRLFPLYWYLALLFALPFFFTFMLLKNNGSTVWLLSALVGLFVMVLLLDWINLLFQITIGVLCAILSYYLTTEVPVGVSVQSLDSAPIFLFAIIMGILGNYTAEKMRAERRQAMLATAGTIAHELRTPLLSIKAGATGLQQFLPLLIDAYHRAAAHGLITIAIRKPYLDSMAGVLDRIEAEADRSNTVIDMLLYTVRGFGVEQGALAPCSMSQCVQAALHRYPFASEKDRALVHWEATTDFVFIGSQLLMVHVIFNLLKNALWHIAIAGKGAISIGIEVDKTENRLIFRDTGPGIPAEVLPHIFRRYYVWPRGGAAGVESTGIGLSFCKEVIKAFGGSIVCHSKLNEYTEFVIEFPGHKK